MHDVIIDDTQTSFVASTQKEPQPSKPSPNKSPKGSRLARLSRYMVDWVETAPIVTLLLSLNILIYVGAGSYNMFSKLSLLTPEVWAVLIGILVCAVILVYCLSFFKFLQNLFIAAIGFYFIIAMFNQFAAFDKNAMLSSLTATYISQDLGLLLTHVSHVVVALILAALFFLFISFASKLKIFVFLLFLLCCNMAVIFSQAIDKNEHQKFNILKEEVINAQTHPGKKFIFIGLNGAGSYAYMENLLKKLPESSAEFTELKKTQDIILGFYAQNNFTFYPQAYVENENAGKNFAQILNPKNNDEKEYVSSTIYPESFWKFNRLNNKDIYLKRNHLFDNFKKSKFSINAYQSTGIELCKTANEMSVQRCVEKNAAPIDFDGMDLTTAQKAKILLVEWLESTQIFTDQSFLYAVFRPFTDIDTLPMVGMSYQNLGIKNGADVLDIVAEDLTRSSGNIAFFVNLDLPQDMYIYDEFCQVKPSQKWINKIDLPWSKSIDTNQKRVAYAQQLRCLYGKLQKFVDEVQKDESSSETVIYIQGLNGLNGMEMSQKENMFIEEFMNRHLVNTAIKDPQKKDFQLKTENCSAPAIMAQYLYRQDQCTGPDLKLDKNLKEKLSQQLQSFAVSPEKTQAAQKEFKNWYQTWQKKQPAEMSKDQNMKKEDKASLVKDQQSKADKAQKDEAKEEIKEEKEVKPAPSVTQPIEEKSEVQTEPLSQTVEKTVEKTEEKTEEKTTTQEKTEPTSTQPQTEEKSK